MAQETAQRDPNYTTTIMGVSLGSPHVATQIYVDETTHRLLVNALVTGSAIPIAGATTAVGVAIVDGSGNQITSFGGGTQYTEDAVAAADPVGNALILVRKDTPSTTVSTDGDNVAWRGSNYGAAYVTLVDNAGAFVSVGGGTQYTQDAALTVATTVGTVAMGRASAAAPSDVSADNDAVIPWYLRSGAQATVLTAAGALIGGDAANGLDVDVTRLSALVAGAAIIGKVGIDQTTPGTTNLVALSAETTKVIGVTRTSDGAGNLLTSNSTTFTAKFGLDVNILGVLGTAFTTAGKVDVKAADGDVFVRQATAGNLLATVNNRDGAGNALTSNSTTFTAKFGLDINLLGTLGTAFSTAGKIDIKAADGDAFVRQATAANLNAQVVGTIAHDGVDSGNPVKVGAKAIASLATTTIVSGADRTDAQSDLDGAIIMRPQFPLADLISERVTNTDGASTAFTNFGAVASTRSIITGIMVMRSDAGTTMASVDFRDGTAGSVLWTMPLPAGGGSQMVDDTGIFKTTANTALAFDVSAALTTVTISVTGFKSKVT